MKQLTIMLLVPDRARADVMLTPDRAYYRFATADTEEDGDLPGLGDKFDETGMRILAALEPLPGETPIAPEDMKITVFVDNVLQKREGVTNESLRRAIRILDNIDDVFNFLNGFA